VHDGGVAGVGGLAEVVDGDVLQPVGEEGGEALVVTGRFGSWLPSSDALIEGSSEVRWKGSGER
jgi:hypothetical protein